MAERRLARMRIPGGMPIRRVTAVIAAMATATGIDGQRLFISERHECACATRDVR
jgi:hypothetical protein